MGIGARIDSGIFDSIAGLPLHPLVVHVVVVVLPVAALAMILLALIPRLRPNFATITTLAVLVGSAAGLVAKESGEALARRVGTPADHQAWADRLVIAAAVLSALTLIWYVADWRSRRTVRPRRSAVALATDLLVVVASGAVLYLAVMTGHSGATAVWGATLNATNAAATSTRPATGTAQATSTQATSPTQATSTETTPTRTAADGSPLYSLATVQQHASPASCWVAIDSQVYDLTRWIPQHPGGPARIEAICGTDATTAFADQHSGEQRPAAELAHFRIGSLG